MADYGPEYVFRIFVLFFHFIHADFTDNSAVLKFVHRFNRQVFAADVAWVHFRVREFV